MPKKKPQKPIFLFDDVAKQKSLLHAYETKLTSLNDLIIQLENVQEKPLNDDEIEILSTDPKVIVDGIKAGVRAKFPFPKAPDKKNLELLGIDFTFIDGIMSTLTPTPFKYDVKNRSIISDTGERAKLIKSCKQYTGNDRQVETYQELEKICDGFNALIDSGVFTNGMTFHFIKRMSSMLLTNVSGKIEINYQRLLQL